MTVTIAELKAAYPDVSEDILRRNFPESFTSVPSPSTPDSDRKAVKGNGHEPIPLSTYKPPSPVKGDPYGVHKLQVALGVVKPIIITFPRLPPSELYQNRVESSHWRVRQKAAKKAREEAADLAMATLASDNRIYAHNPISCCRVEIQVTVPTHHRRDHNGILSACKSWLDGLVDAGLMVDDDTEHLVSLTSLPVIYDKGVSKTEIRIFEV